MIIRTASAMCLLMCTIFLSACSSSSDGGGISGTGVGGPLVIIGEAPGNESVLIDFPGTTQCPGNTYNFPAPDRMSALNPPEWLHGNWQAARPSGSSILIIQTGSVLARRDLN